MTIVVLMIVGILLLVIYLDIKLTVLWEVWAASRGYDALEQVESLENTKSGRYAVQRRAESQIKKRILRND